MSGPGDPDYEWPRTAQALGLPLCRVVRYFDPMEATVDCVRRHVGPPGAGGAPDQHWMVGERDGVAFVVGGRTFNVPVEGRVGPPYYSQDAYQQHGMLWLAEIDPPLWMGLRVLFDRRSPLRPGSYLEQDFARLSSFLQAWDPAQATQLWSYRHNDGRDAWEGIMWAVRAGLDVQLDDHGLRFSRHGYALIAQAVAPPLDVIVNVVRRLKETRAQMGPAPWELAAAETMASFARSHGMEVDRPRLRAHAQLEGCDVDVRLESHAQPRTLLTVRFPNPVGLRLQIQPGHASRLPKFLGGQDVVTGDRAFDDAFVVHGVPEALVRETVHEGMRRDLLALAAMGARVEVQDDHLEAWVAGLGTDAGRLDELLGRGLAVVRGFWHPVATAGAASPYR